MRISKIHVERFKRFEDLTISELSRDHRFVFLLGPNGSGKSSIFEAFNVCRTASARQGGFDPWYYLKSSEDADEINRQVLGAQQNDWGQALKKISVEFHDRPPPRWSNAGGWEASAFQLRGSNRATPDYYSSNMEDRDSIKAFRPSWNIILSDDYRLRQNYQRLVHHNQVASLNPGCRPDAEVVQESLRLIRQVQEATARVFPGL